MRTEQEIRDYLRLCERPYRSRPDLMDKIMNELMIATLRWVLGERGPDVDAIENDIAREMAVSEEK